LLGLIRPVSWRHSDIFHVPDFTFKGRWNPQGYTPLDSTRFNFSRL
jgi:hypothetical protein